MKTNALRRSGGFTLVEILTVISILAILAALTTAAVKFAGQRARVAKTQAHLKAIENALEKYSHDYGIYPQISAAAQGQTCQISGYTFEAGAASALYQALSGDGDNYLEGGQMASQGRLNPESDRKLYWDGADYESNPQRAVYRDESGRIMMVDGFGAPWQYRSPVVASGNNEPQDDRQQNLNNPNKYDLWSVGPWPDNPGEPFEKARFIKNW